jgi:hypothetical protein
MDRYSPPFFGAFHALAVDDRECRLRRSARERSRLGVECVMDARQRSVAVPFDEIVVDRALGGKVLGQLPPLAARRQHVEDAVKDLAAVGCREAPPDPRRRQVRLDQRPFFVRQITRIPRRAPLIARPVLGRPHASPRPNHAHGERESQRIHRIQQFSGRAHRRAHS